MIQFKKFKSIFVLLSIVFISYFFFNRNINIKEESEVEFRQTEHSISRGIANIDSTQKKSPKLNLEVDSSNFKTIDVKVVFSNKSKKLNLDKDSLTPSQLHAYNLKRSKYKKNKGLSRKERKSLGLPPNAYNERFYELTMNPYLGYPTTEKKHKIQDSIFQ